MFEDHTESHYQRMRETSQVDRRRCGPCYRGHHLDCHGQGLRDAAGEYDPCRCWCRGERELYEVEEIMEEIQERRGAPDE